MKKKRRRGNWLWKGLAFIVASGIFWVAYVQWNIHTVQDARLSESVDVGIVLGAALRGEEPSPGLRERLDHALDLYEEGRFTAFIVSGGYDVPTSSLTEAEGMKRYLVAQGVPDEAVILENEATSTYENLRYSQDLMNEHGYETAVIITHSYHGARAQDMAAFLGIEPAIVSTTPSKVMNMSWHKFRETLAYTKWSLEKWKMLWLE
ncbi:YdcF family protein [Marinicrinis sediminis]|uniref:YdcF family protein n=1 Tax=Marinicrinis sediminis TaxID=1652465 RepID=A0ABW5RE78_9BACL